MVIKLLLTIFFLAQVEDIDTISCAIDRDQNRVDTVLNVEVRLALLPIAKHFELRWIYQQFSIEIEHMAVSVTLAKNRNEAEDETLESKRFAIG